jgi:hypothetical protein
MSSDTERAIEEILNDFERQPLQDKRTFRAYLNQPELISLSSTNAQQQSPPISPLTFAQYYNFTVNLPRPALDAKSLQLLKAVIPQAQCSIPDYSLVFCYYKLRLLPIDSLGFVHYVDKPTYENLYFVRLLPSYYKPELLAVSQGEAETAEFGYNRTFNDYEELEKELKKCCINDPITNNNTGTIHNKYLPNDITFNYNRTNNKFEFLGLDLTANAYPTFDISLPYLKNAVVTYLGITYLAKQNVPANFNFPSAEPAFWLDTTQFDTTINSFNAYLIAGYNDPNVKLLCQTLETELVDYNQDFTTIFSIPGNQYVEGQTLARRLGFTWNSEGMIVDNINDVLGKGVVYGGTTVLFYNRLRFVPNYLIAELGGVLGTSQSVDSFAYTADGYCNLVYSSVISIYTTIIGTSTVDTQRNANLLSMIPMDCGNLGVAMVGNYIDNALTKIQGDIYSIYIELRDENGQPYYLTNNATTTLLIKLTY